MLGTRSILMIKAILQDSVNEKIIKNSKHYTVFTNFSIHYLF